MPLEYDRKRIRLGVNDPTGGPVGKYVDVYEMPVGRIRARAKGGAPPRGIFDPHRQHGTHAAIGENEHLSAIPAHIEREREKATPPHKIEQGQTCRRAER